MNDLTTTQTIPFDDSEEFKDDCMAEDLDLYVEEPEATPERRAREGEIYYVADDAAPDGWSIVEIASDGGSRLAAFALGQTEAIPLSEIEERILAEVPRPRAASPRIAA
jgi:hypothetical protein